MKTLTEQEFLRHCRKNSELVRQTGPVGLKNLTCTQKHEKHLLFKEGSSYDLWYRPLQSTRSDTNKELLQVVSPNSGVTDIVPLKMFLNYESDPDLNYVDIFNLRYWVTRSLKSGMLQLRTGYYIEKSLVKGQKSNIKLEFTPELFFTYSILQDGSRVEIFQNIGWVGWFGSKVMQFADIDSSSFFDLQQINGLLGIEGIQRRTITNNVITINYTHHYTKKPNSFSVSCKDGMLQYAQ